MLTTKNADALPELPTPEMPDDEIIRRLIAWNGGIFALIHELAGAVRSYLDATEGLTREEHERTDVILERLEEWARERCQREDPKRRRHAAAIRAAFDRYYR